MVFPRWARLGFLGFVIGASVAFISFRFAYLATVSSLWTLLPISVLVDLVFGGGIASRNQWLPLEVFMALHGLISAACALLLARLIKSRVGLVVALALLFLVYCFLLILFPRTDFDSPL